MQYQEFIDFLQNVGKDPSRLIFEDELTGIHNRRFLHSYLEHRIRWEGDDYPLSLLVIDLDKFKQINDTHGHDIGDQVLTWVAALLSESAGEGGFPIRYGGDEFMMLLPNTGPDGARAVADRLLQRTRDRPVRVRDASLTLQIRLSIGVASAPEDGTDRKSLTQAADTALYHAKQSGRNQAASAGEIDLKKVFSKTALNRLKVSGIAGRDEQLAVVAEVLQGLTEGKSRFVVFEGAPGIGKTTLLQTVHHNFSSDESLAVASVSGDGQEGYRPYYLAARILIGLLNQRDDKGSAVLDSLDEDEIRYLSHVLPQLGDPEGGADANHSTTRQAIFATLARFLPRVIEFRPLILIVDDIHFADEATLLLLRVLVERPGLTLFVCGASGESMQLAAAGESPPLEQLLAATTGEFSIQREKLGPLTAGDIANHLRGVFPGLRMPAGFEQDLAGITQGNPLFLGEIIRKLVTDQKVNLVGQEWTIEPLAEGYLPRSLDEVVMEQIAALDEDERKLLEQASTFGEGIPLSVLAGSSELDETKVLEFLDRAEALGLIAMDFQVNDDVMRFLGKRVLEISYGAIDEDRRKQLHEDVGTYQEDLYQQQLMPSASLLAYHFKRSANQQKARRYELDQLVYTQTVFSSDEAASYAKDLWLDEEEDTEVRLDPEGLRQVPKVLRSLMSTARNILLYPPESKAIARSLNDVKTAVEAVLATNERLHLSQSQRVLLANGQRLDLSEVKVLATSFLELLTRCELQGMVFHQGITDEETRALMMTLGHMKPEGVEKGFWREFVVENRLEHVELHQTRYATVRKKRVSAAAKAIVDEELSPEDLAEIPKILRALQAAATNIKLYPLDAEPVSQSIAKLLESLQGILANHRAVTLARAGEALLVNGMRVDTSSYAAVADGFASFADPAGLDSISFLSHVTVDELETFIGALRDLPTHPEKGFWEEFHRQHGLAGVAFNERKYALGVVQTLLGTIEGDIEEDLPEISEEFATQIDEGAEGSLRATLPRFGKELLVRGEHQLVRRLLHKLFGNFAAQDALTREETVESCHRLLAGLILGLQHRFTEVAADYVLAAFTEETELRVAQELVNLLYDMVASSIQFADYSLAGRLLSEIKVRRETLLESRDAESQRFAKMLSRRLDAASKTLIEADLKSGDPERQEAAAQVMGSLGAPGIPLLISVIKQERDLRARQTAACLLAELGREGGREMKRAVATEVLVEQRFRALEVIDTVTRDLRDELEYSLGDANPKIRRAAFQLFERLRQDELIDVVVPYASKEDHSLAKGAIRSLAALKSQRAATAVASVLNETKDDEIAMACCQALGQIGHPAGIEALAKALKRKDFFGVGTRQWEEQVRATAAIALRQIDDPKAVKVLSRYVRDPDRRVEQLARSAAAKEAS